MLGGEALVHRSTDALAAGAAAGIAVAFDTCDLHFFDLGAGGALR